MNKPKKQQMCVTHQLLWSLLWCCTIAAVILFIRNKNQNHRLNVRSRKSSAWPEWPNNGNHKVHITIDNKLCTDAWMRYLTRAADAWSKSNVIELSIANYALDYNASSRYRSCDESDMLGYKNNAKNNHITITNQWKSHWTLSAFVKTEIMRDDLSTQTKQQQSKLIQKNRLKSALIILNDSKLLNSSSVFFSYDFRMKTICKSLGFALGLYNAGNNLDVIPINYQSCMDNFSLHFLPSDYDFELLQSMYLNMTNRRRNLKPMDDVTNERKGIDDNANGKDSNIFYVEEQLLSSADLGKIVKEINENGQKTRFYIQDDLSNDFTTYTVTIEYNEQHR